EYHEFVLASHRENQKHAELMKKSPNMEHNDPNAKRLSGLSSGELLWKFTRRGEFEYACLIPGHFQAGMHGKIIMNCVLANCYKQNRSRAASDEEAEPQRTPVAPKAARLIDRDQARLR